MVLETWVFTALALASGGTGGSPLGGQAGLLRLFRLLRLSRLLRMLRSLPELMILIKGMVTAMRSVMYVLCLLLILIYVFAIAFTQLSVDTEVGRQYFDNVALSMYSLLIYATFMDELSSLCDDIRHSDKPEMLAIVFVFVGLAALTVMNMLIGVLCEVVSAVAATEKEEIRTTTVVEKFRHILDSIDEDSNGLISYKEFKCIMQHPEALQALEEVGVDPVGLLDFADMFFLKEDQPQGLSFEKFMSMLLDLRGSNIATVSDVMHLTTQANAKMVVLTHDVKDLQQRTLRMQSSQKRVEGQLKSLLRHFSVPEPAHDVPRASSQSGNFFSVGPRSSSGDRDMNDLFSATVY
jgi:hypothetical protein